MYFIKYRTEKRTIQWVSTERITAQSISKMHLPLGVSDRCHFEFQKGTVRYAITVASRVRHVPNFYLMKIAVYTLSNRP